MPTTPLPNYTDYDTERADLERKKAYAQLLQQQSTEGMPQGGMVGNVFVAPSWTQQLAQALKGPIGVWREQQAVKQQKALNDRAQSDFQDWIANQPTDKPAMPAQTAPSFARQPNADGSPQQVETSPAIPAQPVTQQQRLAWAIRGLNNPMAAPFANMAVQQIMGGGKYGNTVHYDQSGRAFLTNEMGGVKYLDGVTARDKPEAVNTGGATVFVNPFQMNGQTIQHTMTPGEVANLGIQRANLGIRAAEADPMGMLGIRQIAGGVGAPAMGTPTAAGQSATMPGATGTLHGDDLLNSIPQPVADQVKALAEGRLQFPAGFALKSPYWQNMISLVSAYDPNFDAVNYNARAKTRADFTSGQSAKNVTAINTAIGHLKTLNDAAGNLNNTSLTPVNAVVNYAKQLTGNPNITNFDVARNAVGDELMRVFRGSGASEHEAQAWKNTIAQSASPEQLKAAISQAGDLLESRITALNDTYNRGMGTTADVLQMVSPKSRDVLNKLRGQTGQNAPADIHAQAQAILRGGK